MTSRTRRLAGHFFAVLALVALALPARAYDYPITDRFAATIVGTPPELEAIVPAKVPIKIYQLPPRGPVPEMFWHQEGLHFSLARQKGRAPLVFLIAGTGAAYDSSKNLFLQKALYGAGFHVIALSSPTRFNFIINASTTGLTGYLPDDTLDLYRVMEQAWARVKDKVDASEFSVAGYSLGGIGAAFIAQHDEQARSFNFRRVLMINPPVDLYNSAVILDEFLDRNVKVGGGGATNFLDQVIERLATAYQPDEGLRMDEDFLYRAYVMKKAQGKSQSMVANPEAALIGVSFRVSASAMLFAGDVMAGTGYITPVGKHWGKGENLEYYGWASAQVPFRKYVDELLLPKMLERHPGSTREQLLREASLRGIEDYIRGNDKVWAQTNADEIILAPGELDWLKAAMGSRVRVYPHGGHCGNLGYRDNVRDSIAVLRGEALAGDAT